MNFKVGKRTVGRIKVLCRIYQYDLLSGDIGEDCFDDLLRETGESVSYDREFADELYEGIISKLKIVDRRIALSLENYAFDRLSYVDRSLLRIGTYEMIYTETPHPIIIDEIVRLSKEYSQTEDFRSSSFNNSVLDAVSKALKRGKTNG